MSEQKPRSAFWYLLPLVLAIIGGVIAFFILRNKDSRKARNCLIIGIVITIIGFIGNTLFNSVVALFPDSEIIQESSKYIETYGFTAFLTGLMIPIVVTIGIGLILYNNLRKKIKSKPIVYGISVVISITLLILYELFKQTYVIID